MKHRTGYLFKRGDNWYVRWSLEGKQTAKALRDANGQPITTRREAEIARDKIMKPMALASEAEALRAIAERSNTIEAMLDSQRDAMTLPQAWSHYLASPKRPDTGPDTLLVYEGQFGQFTKWMAEKHPEVTSLRGVSSQIVEEYAGHLNHGRLSPNTFNKHLNVLTLVFEVLRDKARVERNHWQGIKRKKLVPNSRRELTVDELRRVCGATTGDMRVLFALGVYTGLRLKDCISLRWGELDLAQGLIRRIPSKTARRNPKPVIIPIHESLRTLLAELPRENGSDYLMPGLAEKYLAGSTSKRQIINSIQDRFTAQEIQIYKPGTGPETGKRAVVEVGFHSLRHSFVSLCRASNVPLAVVESIVGHSNPAMTRHYTHVGELAARQAVAALPSMTGDSKPAETKPAPEAILKQAKAIAEEISSKTWKAKKAELMALLPP